MTPELELVETQRDKSFKVFRHDYPHKVARWHFHPEYELHHITASSGKYFVGDYIGNFEPGQLILAGPNLPHNWVSELPDERAVINRDIVLQFSSDFIGNLLAALPELQRVRPLLADAARGVLFSVEVSKPAQTMLLDLVAADGFHRVRQFLALLELLSGDTQRRLLTGVHYRPHPADYMSSAINQVLVYIDEHLATDLHESELAELVGMSASAFSRFFRKQMKLTFVQYIAQLRINRACELLMNTELGVTEICFNVGFNNVSNFNRHFLIHKQIPPSKFRAYHQRLALGATN